ncbi:MAG: DsrE/DsrF/DrsH-like family protein [Nitrospirota bacterium]|nr:DsrE/DsrF/DrsH-like family protein [Nitrospirota bacterium]
MGATEKDIDAIVEERVQAVLDRKLDALVDERVARALAEHEARQAPGQLDRIAIVASKGSLDMAYPPLILATTAAAMGMEAGIFFTFYGLDIINKKKNRSLGVPPVGNPAMPVPVPNIIGMLPGMTSAATMMMKNWMGRVKLQSVPEFLDMALDLDVKLIGCQMTMDVMGTRQSDLIDGVQIGGAATFLEFSSKAKTSLFV